MNSPLVFAGPRGCGPRGSKMTISDRKPDGNILLSGDSIILIYNTNILIRYALALLVLYYINIFVYYMVLIYNNSATVALY